MYIIRNQRVIPDKDLAEMYGVTTGNLHKAVRRKIERFPEDFYVYSNKRRTNLDIPKTEHQVGAVPVNFHMHLLHLVSLC